MATQPVCRACMRSLARPSSRNAVVQLQSLKPGVRSSIIARNTRSNTSNYLRTTSNTHLTRSYATQSAPAPPPPPRQQDATDSLEDAAEQVPTERDVVREATESLFKECASQADYIVPQAFQSGAETPTNAAGEELGQGSGWWYESMNLQPTFSTWSQITMLHMHILIARMRYFPPEASTAWAQALTDHFFYEAEHRMTIFHQITSRGYRNRYLKDLHNQWRGVMAAYDEGIVRGDAVLATAIWRNVFKAREDVDWRNVAAIVAFMRRALAALDRSPDRTVVNAMVKFGNPLSGMPLVQEPARMMDEPFNQEDEEALKLLWEGKTGQEQD